MDYKSAARDVGKGQVSPVYVCYGTETYLLKEFIAFLTQKLIEPEYREFAVSKYDLAETPLDVVLEDAQTLPFMAPKKLVIADNATFFTGAKDGGKIDHQPEKLLDYMKAPSDFAVIVLTVEAEKLDERKKIVKGLKEVTVPFLPMSAEQLLNWVNRQAERQSFVFAEGAADQLILYTGGSLQALAAEISKLSLFVGAGGTVTGDVVDRLVTRSTEQNVFILIDDIVRLRLNRAFEILYDLLKQKEEPVKIVLLIARQFRIVLQVMELSKLGYSHQQMASQLGLHPYAVKIAAEQGQSYTPDKLERILSQLAELDYKMKSGKVDKVMGLELFLMRLAG
ncbi:DNA polymerase III subunit delta [Paenibacillus flagellatus]|uniref:DNA polymerase III subunit delta n=1 Tax=Paenibacillus flagellatus TaxID=2211139 RepID=A0A2V5KD87_9BACL|nr:DNA polymerase III subunit delta [Paenibacillus flagellatus]PYI51860.1 DNA polymerase III subunit delta [Paenibacillus flagellatus]